MDPGIKTADNVKGLACLSWANWCRRKACAALLVVEPLFTQDTPGMLSEAIKM